ncbi:hypothetical protein NC797_07020 [Aquibacillus sp. 3ASR75-11]|uniref:Uncharacterized protein n=1 Tax=Terrihalobacillus insolitus TaxID=2950438 RepID=A0A9X3WVM7_9BACI|nr:hypothetical protein [Terrihalobacillus insolitus]MDC3424259.1 hypothetical protein [Terrihalobacillus insolitus]
MELYWQFAGNDPVAKQGNYVFRLHEQFVKTGKQEYEEQIFILQIRKHGQTTFKDLGYYFYAGNPEFQHRKSVDGQPWDDIDKIITRTEEILKVLDFID